MAAIPELADAPRYGFDGSANEKRRSNAAALPFYEVSYRRHADNLARYVIDPEQRKIAASWYDVDSADAWLQERTYEIADHLGVPGEKWVTIGDGRFGLDSVRLMAHGVRDILATDIDATLLKVAKAQGKLRNYRVENAERLSFEDKSFDYVFCKETLQQCPRPALALYEMLRIARRGVILIEPNDRIDSPVRIARRLSKSLRGRRKIHPEAGSYEKAGNYVSTVSRREIEKIALALDIPQLAFKGLNDAYKPGLEFEGLNSPRGDRMRRQVLVRDLLCRVRLDKPMVLMAAIFHLPVTGNQRAGMENSGWDFVDLPGNPYILHQP